MPPRPMPHHNSTAFFVRGPRPFARLIFFAALSLALMATDSRLHYLTEVRQGLMVFLQPLQLVASTPVNLYVAAKEYFVTHNTLLSDNRRLAQQTLEQSAELQRLHTLETENAYLRKLLGTAQSLKQPAQLGEILHMGRDPFTHKIVVNLGSSQHIEAGQAVVDEAGVIGQVTRVYPFSSEVTLITDKDLAIPIQIARNGLRAIAFGHGRDTMIDLPYLPANVDIRKGDKLVTSGIDGIYPVGLAVAEVISIERTPDSPFAHIVCQPVAGIENHRQILLLSIPKTGVPVPANASANIEKSSIDKKPTATAPVKPKKPEAPATPHASH